MAVKLYRFSGRADDYNCFYYCDSCGAETKSGHCDGKSLVHQPGCDGKTVRFRETYNGIVEIGKKLYE